MLVIPYWSVKPTAARARIDAVTRPNPTDGTNADAITMSPALLQNVHDSRARTLAPPHHRSPRGFDLFGRVGDDRRQCRVGFHDLELPRRVAPLIEHDRPDSADVLDLLAGEQRLLALREVVDDDRASFRG